MSDFHDHYPNYEVMSNHDEEHGKKSRRTLWNVFWVMLAITVFELVVGFLAPSKGWSGTWWIKTLFISLTIVKAAAIVLWFMHLGHEKKVFKYTILMPYVVFMFYL
ncbi:MAG: cytochrome C oxidase subunit IV family protein, partial [Bacteroidota bacterium]